MAELSEFPIEVHEAASAPASTQNVVPLLHEIRHALTKLLQSDESTTIDLLSIPMTDADLQALEEALGNGEIDTTITALGTSRIRETRYPGVWLIEHYNVADSLMAKFIEVTRLPEILKADPRDIDAGLQRLSEQLSNNEPDETD